MKINLLQLEFSPEDKTFDRIEKTIETVRKQPGADMIALPELWPVGAFSPKKWAGEETSLDGPFVKRFQDVAQEVGSYIHLGSFLEAGPVKAWNTSVLISPAGEIAATYRKIHTFGFSSGEAKYLAGGSELSTAVLDLPTHGSQNKGVIAPKRFTVGLATCYDLRFPELFRLLLDRGAQMILLPAAWPEARIAHWKALTQARAIENQAFVVATNTVGVDGKTRMGGTSRVIGPTGEIVAEAGNSCETLVVEINTDDVAIAREQFPVLADRKIDTSKWGISPQLPAQL